MPTRYKAADRACAKLERQIAAEFQNLRLRFPLDHLNVAGLRKYTKTMYDRMEKRNFDAYVLIAMTVYADMNVAEAERLVTLLMGDKVEPRRDYIATYADFNKVDTFLEKQEGKPAALR